MKPFFSRLLLCFDRLPNMIILNVYNWSPYRTVIRREQKARSKLKYLRKDFA